MSISIDKDSRILITGATGLIGRALRNVLNESGYSNLIAIGSGDCDLRDSIATGEIFNTVRPDFVFHLAARVYGIGGNQKYKSDILYDNVMINTNVVESSRVVSVKKIVAMGSGCVYPVLEDQSELLEHQIWDGPPHPSEDSYAHSKRLMFAHLTAAREQYNLSFAFAISGNLYGPFDNFNVEVGHVIPSLVAKFYQAKTDCKTVVVWGSGVAIRDFSYCDDAARALYFIMQNIEGPVNLGSGMLHSINDIVECLSNITGVDVTWDNSKPDGQLARYYNLSQLNRAGFKAKTTLEEGIQKTYNWYANNYLIAKR